MSDEGLARPVIPTDPLIYRYYEIMQVYGTTLKEVIHEQFGDGIVSDVDFTMDVQRVPDPKGDRVRVTMEGTFCLIRSGEDPASTSRRPTALPSLMDTAILALPSVEDHPKQPIAHG